MLINLNFTQINQLARQDSDQHILLKKNVQFEDNPDSFFPDTPDKILFDHSSDFMKMIQSIFWDNRPKVISNLHSTNMNLLPTNYFFHENLKFKHILDKSLVGMQQSRTTELSTTYARIKQTLNDFLRSVFVFEKDDIFKYERMYTKLINLNVRHHIAREIFYIRELKIYPFEPLPQDPLKQKNQIWESQLSNLHKKLTSEKKEDK